MKQFSELSLNPVSSRLLEAYIKKPAQSILLAGPSGSGLLTVANSLVQRLAGNSGDSIFVLPDEKGTITIDRVRRLYAETRNKHSTLFVVVIDDIDTMSHDAQNAFLKLLEEPADNVHFVLTSHRPENLLSTIQSRVTTVAILPISKTASSQLIQELGASAQNDRLLFIAEGLPAELTRLSTDSGYFERQSGYVRDAKQFLSSTVYERLALVSKIANREDALKFVEMVAKLLNFMAFSKSKQLVSESTTQVVETTAKRLLQNGHVRTQLANLALNVV